MRNRYITLVAATALVSCGGDDTATDDTAAPDVTDAVVETIEPRDAEPEPANLETTQPETTQPETTQPETTEPGATEPEATEDAPATFEMIDCEQIAMYVPLEASAAQARVPTDVDLVVENGQVTSLFLVHECADTAVDGAPSGAAHVIAQWLPIAGPDEVREGPHFEGAPVLPTGYWESAYAATDNPLMQQLMLAADLDMSLVDSMSFDVAWPDTPEGFYGGHTGEVDAPNAEPVVSYSWVTMNYWGDHDVVYGDQPTGFVHVVGGLELEAVGNIHVADVPFCHLVEADGPNEPIPGPFDPETLGPADPTSCLMLTFERLRFEAIS